MNRATDPIDRSSRVCIYIYICSRFEDTFSFYGVESKEGRLPLFLFERT